MIRWVSDNPAELLGILDEASKFYQRRGYFASFLEAGVVSLSNGKVTVDLQRPSRFSRARSPTRPRATRRHAHRLCVTAGLCPTAGCQARRSSPRAWPRLDQCAHQHHRQPLPSQGRGSQVLLVLINMWRLGQSLCLLDAAAVCRASSTSPQPPRLGTATRATSSHRPRSNFCKAGVQGDLTGSRSTCSSDEARRTTCAAAWPARAQDVDCNCWGKPNKADNDYDTGYEWLIDATRSMRQGACDGRKMTQW